VGKREPPPGPEAEPDDVRMSPDWLCEHGPVGPAHTASASAYEDVSYWPTEKTRK